MTKIIIATTFRDFIGDENDKIQRLFLESIKNQTYKNWELVVTVFNEKKVESVLQNSGLNVKIYNEKKGGYKFSLTKVFLNGYMEIKKYKNSILIWTTADVIFEKKFFNKIRKYNSTKTSLISHPNIQYLDVKDFLDNSGTQNTPNSGIDFVCFSSESLVDNFIDDVKSYFFKNWGVFEHFLVALSDIYCDERRNLWGKSNVSKISNDRNTHNETEDYFMVSSVNNGKVFNKFLNDKNLPNTYWKLDYCNSRFKPFNGFIYKSYFLVYYLNKKIIIIRDCLLSCFAKLYHYFKKHENSNS